VDVSKYANKQTCSIFCAMFSTNDSQHKRVLLTVYSSYIVIIYQQKQRPEKNGDMAM